MCGRYVSATSPDDIASYFGADVLGESLTESVVAPSWNVAPTQSVMAVRDDRQGHRRIDAFRWGLVPFWAKDEKVGSRMINARSETAAEKNAFRRALVKRRCIIPADGFFEWQKPATRAEDAPKTKGKGRSTRKQPWYITPSDGTRFAFAGLFEVWKGPDNDQPALYSCTILTGKPNDKMAQIHDRMPVMLPAPAWDQWLDPTLEDAEQVTSLFSVAPSELLELTPVSTAVNRVSNNEPSLVTPLGAEQNEGAESPPNLPIQDTLL